MADARARVFAGLAGGLAAFLWAGYYILLVLLPSVPGETVVVIPFLVAGAAFLLWHPGRAPGGARVLLSRLISRKGIGIGTVLLVLQIDVVLATRWTGPVDASLVTLLADVVATPLLVFALLRQDADRFRSVAFWSGVGIATVGAVATIVAGGPTQSVSFEGALSLVPLPFLIAVYFVWVNEESRTTSSGEVLGAASLVAGLVGILGGALIYGTGWMFAPLTWFALLTLAVMGITSFYIAPWAYFWAAQKTSILIPAVLQALIPVFTLVMVAMLGVRIPWVAWIGVPLAFFGSAIAVLDPSSGRPKAPGGSAHSETSGDPRGATSASGKDAGR